MASSPLDHAAEFRRCLEMIDVKGVRRLWRHVSPHLPQPKDDDDALYTIHLARVAMKDAIAPALRQYSEAWLNERKVGRVAHAVGIAVGMKADWEDPRLAEQFLNVRGEMEHAVTTAIADGVELETESVEVKARMMLARERAR